jgi:hypothetical protein
VIGALVQSIGTIRQEERSVERKRQN